MIWLSEHHLHLPSFGNIWDIMGYQPVIVNTLLLAILAKKT